MEKAMDPRFVIQGCEDSDKEAIVRPTITYAQDAWRRLRKNPIAWWCWFCCLAWRYSAP